MVAEINMVEVEIETKPKTETDTSKRSGFFCWKGRTKNERYLLLAFTTVLFVAVLLAFSLASFMIKGSHGNEKSLPQPQPLLRTKDEEATALESSSDVCLTKGCVKSAAAVIDRMNDTAKPCDDFFDFACGNFVSQTIIPDEKSSVTMFSKVQDKLLEKMRLLVEEEVKDADSPATLMVKNLYASCTNTTQIAEMGLKPLRKILNNLGGWPVVEGEAWNETAFSWIQTNYHNRKIGFSSDYLFDFSVTIDVRNSTWRMIWVDQPSLGMSREYLMRGLNDTDVQAYLTYSTHVAELLGATPEDAKKQMKDILDFQIQVANISMPREERRNMTKLYNVMTLRELMKITPDIPWVDYINELLPPPLLVDLDERVGVSDPNFFRNLTKILDATPKRVVANYMLWRVAAAAASYLSDDIRDLQLEYSKKLSGKATRPPRWKECMGIVSGKLAYSIGNLYAKNFFNEEAKNQALELVSYVKAEFHDIINTIDWMDNTTRVAAVAKLKSIKSHIAYPKELLVDENLTEHYADLTIDLGSLLQNMQNVGIFGTDYSFSKLRKIVDKLDWKRQAAVAVVNAYYSSIENSIKFPAGILQNVFFEPDRPKFLNFGGIGFVIGHEITHGFDDQGKQFDSEGNLLNWWEESTEKKFLEKAKCIIHQYGNYTVPENNMMLNGINTQGENIADNGGIKEAYLGYQKWVADNGQEKKLPGLKYSPNQLFWISAAQVWCSKYRPESLKIRILTGVHSPGRFRIMGSFSNSHEFASDWNCPAGSKMNPVKKCNVW